MIFRLLCGLGIGTCALRLMAAEAPPPLSPILDPVKEGLELAARVRAMVPAEGSEFRGVLQVTARNGNVLRKVPIRSRVSVASTNWQVIYESEATPGQPGERLVIVHQADGNTTYRLCVGTNTNLMPPLTIPFAGSDFWLQDLGLEFFHWPQQKALRAEMTRSRPCRVLESVTPHAVPGDYGRVLSWIDVDSGGILQAEAYSSDGVRLKKFSVGSFEKVKGNYELRDVKIRNVRTGQQTELKFQLNNKPD